MMKLTQKQICSAYGALCVITGQRISSGTAKKAFLMREALQPFYDFQTEEQNKLFAEHPRVNPKTMTIHLKDESEREGALEEMKDIERQLMGLAELEQEVDIAPFEIWTDDEPGLKISGNEIGNLRGLIDFK